MYENITTDEPRQPELAPTRTISRNTEAYIVTVLTPKCLLVETEDGAYLGQCTSWPAVWRLLDAVESYQ